MYIWEEGRVCAKQTNPNTSVAMCPFCSCWSDSCSFWVRRPPDPESTFPELSGSVKQTSKIDLYMSFSPLTPAPNTEAQELEGS
jgi:hypothetical protein